MLNLFSESEKKQLQLIGINGKAGAGKDFIADNFLKGYFRISFADHFKCDVVGKGIFTYEQVFVTKEPEVRHRLQQIGTEEGREVFGYDVWVNCIEAWMYTIYKKNNITKFCFADVRFDNEAEFILNMGGKVIKIQSDRVLETMDDEAKSHKSESGVSDNLVTGIVTNNKNTTIDQLLENMKLVCYNW